MRSLHRKPAGSIAARASTARSAATAPKLIPTFSLTRMVTAPVAARLPTALLSLPRVNRAFRSCKLSVTVFSMV